MSAIVVVQARIGSSRFPRKILADLGGKPLLAHVVDRARQIRGVDRVIVAVPQDDLAEIAEALRGKTGDFWFEAPPVPANDVLARFVAALERFPNCDTVMRITADCPCLDPRLCERVLDLYRRDCRGVGYAWTDTQQDYADGLDVEIFARSLLEQANRMATDPYDKEHVTSWMRRKAPFVYALERDPQYRGWPKLSVDSPADLDLVRAWMEHRKEAVQQ